VAGWANVPISHSKDFISISQKKSTFKKQKNKKVSIFRNLSYLKKTNAFRRQSILVQMPVRCHGRATSHTKKLKMWLKYKDYVIDL
jgi:hypothetical protein